MNRGRELLAGGVLAGLSIVFALGLLEIGVRALHLVPDRFWEPDPVLGVRLVPSRDGWWTQEDREFLTRVHINREGLRDDEHAYDKPAGVFRILVLGDSFVEALHVPLEATFPHQLRHALQTDGARLPVETISAGVSGYGTASELLYFEREGQRYHPDLVLLAFYPGNDVKNNSPELEDTLKPVYGGDDTIARVTADPGSETAHGWRGLLARSAAYHYFRQVLLLRHPQLAQWLVRHRLLKASAVRSAPQQDGVPTDYGVYAPQPPPLWQSAWTHTDRLLERLQQSVEAAGARFAIAILSTRDQIYPAWWQEVVDAHPKMRELRWDLDAPQEHMETWCASHHVPCVTLAPSFRRAAEHAPEPLHFHHDGHWTVAGHHVAGQVLAKFLSDEQLVPSPH